MFISGHKKILKEVLKSSRLKKYYKEIKKGIIYIDLPCGKYKKINNHFYLYNKKICSYLKLHKLFNNYYGNSNIYQQHRGFFAHLHSITTDPLNSVEKIRNKIILSIMGYCLLSIYDDNLYKTPKIIKPNIFWIGCILHIITDSYSRSHTIRDNKLPILSIPLSKIKTPNITNHENIKKLAKKNKIQYLKDPIEYNYYKIFKFEYDLNKLVKKYIKKIPFYTGKEIDGDIINFQYFKNQPSLTHQKYDYFYKNNYYDRMIKDCKYILNIYDEFLIK